MLVTKLLNLGMTMNLFKKGGANYLLFVGFFMLSFFYSESRGMLFGLYQAYVSTPVQVEPIKEADPVVAENLWAQTPPGAWKATPLPPVALFSKQKEVEPEPVAPPTQEPVKAEQPNLWPLPKRMYLSHVEGVGEQSGISYGSDYSTLQLLLAPDFQMGQFMYMIDLRGHRFDNNTFSTNVGLGGRFIPKENSYCELIGLNTYYDWRQGFIGDYHQMGIGMEVLSRRWDFRANVYVPLGAAKNLTTCNYQYDGGYEMNYSDCEFATYGFNAEVGWLAVKQKGFLLYMATGPYYLSRSTCCFDPMRGAEFRIRPQFKDYFAIEGKVSWDSVYSWVYQTQFILSLPLYAVNRDQKAKTPCRISERQIYQPVERFEVMPLGRKQCWTQNF